MQSQPTEEWPEEVLRRAKNYAGADFDKPQQVKETVWYAWHDEEVTIPQLCEMIDSIPDEYGDTARASYESGRYDGGDHFEIYYIRPESEAEVAERVKRCWDYAVGSIQQERAEYERLKAKFTTGE